MDVSGRHVLEIGSGDGRLTFRYAEEAGWVAGIDIGPQVVAAARDLRPHSLERQLSFLPASALALPFRDGSFDIAVLAWSL